MRQSRGQPASDGGPAAGRAGGAAPAARLEDALDLPAIRSLLVASAGLAGLGLALVDLEGRIHLEAGGSGVFPAGNGRHPEPEAGCAESGVAPGREAPGGGCRVSRGADGLFRATAPLTAGGGHVGSLLVGPFLPDDEDVDLEGFRARARRSGLDEESSLAAVARVPRLDRHRVEEATRQGAVLAGVIATLGQRRTVRSGDLEARERALSGLGQSEAYDEALFGDAPVPIWEEDFSLVREALDGLRASGVQDLAAHLGANPAEVVRLAGLVRVLRINETSVGFFGAASKAEVLQELPGYFREDSLPAFRDELVALDSGATRFACEIPIYPPGAGVRLLHLRLKVVAGFERSLGRVVVSFLDVSARRRVEAELRRSEERLRVAAEAADLGTFVHDLVTDRMVLDERCRRLLALPEGEVPFGRVLERIHPWDRERVTRSFPEAFANPEGDGRVALEYRIVRPGGEVRWISVFLKVTMEGAGASRSPILAVGTTQDVTDRKRTEEALRKSEAQQRRLVENLTAGVVVHAPDARVLFANARACSLLGLDLDQMTGRSAVDPVWSFLREDGSRMPPEEFPVARVLADRRPVDDILGGVRRPAPGGLVWVQASAYPEFDAGGELSRVVVTFVDVTHRIRAQAELRVLDAITRLFQRDLSLAESYAEVARILARELRCPITGVELYDREAGEMVFAGLDGVGDRGPGWRVPVGQTLSGLVATRGEPVCLEDATSATGHGSEMLRQFGIGAFVCVPVVVGGTVLGTLALADPHPRSDAASWLGSLSVTAASLAQDIGRRRAEEALRQAQKLEALGTLAGGVAHDFNNILLAIRGNAVLAAHELPDGHPAASHLGEIERGSKRAAALVARILAFARPREGTRSVVRLGDVVTEAVQLLRATLPARVEVRTAFSGESPHASVEAGQIHQVVVNLVTNAAHAIGGRAGTVTLRLDAVDLGDGAPSGPEPLRPGRYARLAVEDDGCGMDAETLARAFDPFFTTKGPGQGSGLGLSMVHGIVRAHGGAVSMRSEAGRGTTATLLFPAAPEPAAAPPAAIAAPPAPARRARLLVVDDDEAIALLSGRYLGRLGYEVTAVTDPREAVQRVEEAPASFDAVVTDLSMPGLSGFEVARRVRLVRPDLAVVLTSGYVKAEDEAEAARIGIDALVLKPDTMDELATVLHGVLSRHAGPRPMWGAGA